MQTAEKDVQTGVEQRGSLIDHPVGRKVQYLRANWQQEGLPSNWYDMPGAGFWVEPQMAQLGDNWTSVDLSSWLTNKVKPDVQGFTLEYLAKRGVFPIQYDIHKQNDGAYLTAPMYGGAKLLDVLNPGERHGALVAGLEKITAFFADKTTPDGSLAVLTSVKGPSNIYDPHTNKEIIFPDSQRYLMQKRGNTIVGFTIRTDASHKEERAFIKAITGKDIPKNARPEEYIRAVACIRADDTMGRPKTFAQIVQLMQKIHGRALAYENVEEGVAIPWEEIYSDLTREDLWDFPGQTRRLFEEYQEFALLVGQYATGLSERLYLRQLLQEGLVATILDISRFVAGEKLRTGSRRMVSMNDDFPVLQAGSQVSLPSYGSAMKTIQNAGGCSSSGKSSGGGGIEAIANPTQRLINSLSPRLGFEEQDEYGSLYFDCPFGADNVPDDGKGPCGRQIKRSHGKLEDACPHCTRKIPTC